MAEPRARSGSRGQVLVETTIIMPVMIFAVLGALQLMVMQHARVITEYAAYCAARAGIVNNGNWNVMRNAAMLAALPVYERTDTLGNFALAYGKMEVLTEATELVDTAGATLEGVVNDLLGINLASNFLPDVSLVEVDVTSPRERDFSRAFAWQQTQETLASQKDAHGRLNYPEQEVDFDSRELIREVPEIGRLAVEVRVLVPLRIPVVNWIMWQLWYAREELRLSRIEGDLLDWARFQGRVKSGAHVGKTLEEVVRDTDGRQVFDDALLTAQRTKEARLLRELATRTGNYLVPLRASYAMQMQSNLYFQNRRQPVWFDLQ